MSTRTFGEAWEDFSRNVDVTGAEIDPDEIFGDVRDQAPGRETSL